jgi:hypothetical protein
MKGLFKVTTRTIVATGLGAAIFTLLFMYVKVPSPIPETSFQTAYGLGAFFAVLFGPIAGGLIAFIGHALSDAVQYGSPGGVGSSPAALLGSSTALHTCAPESKWVNSRESRSSPSMLSRSSVMLLPGLSLPLYSILSFTRNRLAWSSPKASLLQS